MKKLAIVFAVGAAALLGGSAANAADNTVKAKAAADRNSIINRHQLAPSTLASLPPLRLSSLPTVLWKLRLRSAVLRKLRLRSAALLWRLWLCGPSVTFGFGGGGYRGW